MAEPLPDNAEISASLGVSRRMLRACCQEHLGMGPTEYLRLRGMPRVNIV